MEHSLKRIAERIDHWRCRLYGRPNAGKFEELHQKASDLLGETINVLNEMDHLEKIDKCEFKPGVKVNFVGHKDFPHVEPHCGVLTRNMTLGGALAFDYEGYLVGYKYLGKLLRRVNG